MTLSINIIILAAGIGSRMKKQYPDLPKPLIPICNVPMIIRLIHTIIETGSYPIYLIVRKEDKNIFEFELKRYLSSINKINIFCQDDNEYGTASAIKSLLKYNIIADWNMILNADTPCITSDTLKKMISCINKNTDLILGTCHIEDPYSYGRVCRKPFEIIEQKQIDVYPIDHRIHDIHEINTGIYIIRNDLFEKIKDIKKCMITKVSKLTDICKYSISPVFYDDFSYDEIININTPLDKNYAEYLMFQQYLTKIWFP